MCGAGAAAVLLLTCQALGASQCRQLRYLVNTEVGMWQLELKRGCSWPTSSGSVVRTRWHPPLAHLLRWWARSPRD